MGEIKNHDMQEMKRATMDAFKGIQSEKGLDSNSAKGFWDKLFGKAGDLLNEVKDKPDNNEFGAKYNSTEHMLKHIPAEVSEKGHWEGERGESKFVPNDDTEAGLKAKEKLAEYGMDGVTYINNEPDFSKCSEATIRIDNMSEYRYDYYDSNGEKQDGNFSQADIKCADLWNKEQKDGRTDWKKEDVKEWRTENNCVWHERCDTKTMDLLSRDIHNTDFQIFVHSGGCSECKTRDDKLYGDLGGGFDE